MAAPSVTTSNVMKLFNRHLQKRSEKSLRDTPILVDCFDQRPLPGKAGVTMFVPRHIARDQIAALTEGSPIGLCATSAHYYSATVVGYGDARSYSDFLVAVHEIPTMISDDIAGMVRDAGLFIDRLCATAISDSGTFVSPDGSTTEDSVVESTPLRQSALFVANTTLAGKNAPTYADGMYKGVFHPNSVHDLFIATSAGSQLGTYGGFNAGFLENTEQGASKLTHATMGVLGNIRILQNSNAPKPLFNTHTSGAAGMSADNSGYESYIMGPGAAAAVDLSTSKLRTYTKGLGSAGTADPIDQVMTAGVKFYFVALPMDVSNRLVRIPVGVDV